MGKWTGSSDGDLDANSDIFEDYEYSGSERAYSILTAFTTILLVFLFLHRTTNLILF